MRRNEISDGRFINVTRGPRDTTRWIFVYCHILITKNMYVCCFEDASKEVGLFFYLNFFGGKEYWISGFLFSRPAMEEIFYFYFFHNMSWMMVLWTGPRTPLDFAEIIKLKVGILPIPEAESEPKVVNFANIRSTEVLCFMSSLITDYHTRQSR